MFYFCSNRLTNWVGRANPIFRRLILIAIDSALLPLSVWLSFWLRMANPFHYSFIVSGIWLLPLVLLVGLPLYAFTGQYKGITRYAGSTAFYYLTGRNFLLVLILVGIGVMFQLPMPPRSSWILLWLLLTAFTGSIRFALRDFLLNLRSVSHKKNQLRVAIYGAGEAGAQLAAALRLAGNHKIITFIDDNSDFWNRSINGILIHPPQVLSQLDIDQVLLAIPSLTRIKRRQIVNDLQLRGISVLQVPSVDDLTSGRARIDSLRPISIDDLLGRDPVVVDSDLLTSSFRSSVICVTGAGGSIGSELCRQILSLRPSCLILLERSEPSLYAIEQELRAVLPSDVELKPVLGSAANSHLVSSLFTEHEVTTVFHAAAYKHVPLVEANPLSGLANNVFSTQAVCQAAITAGVHKVILISTDKAVRPTNVMGATKRLAELIVQGFSQNSESTCFSMVRFGNVLGSSGSVVPLFRRQIVAGGPITLTHPEIIRFFMTIPEAAQLVLHASQLAEGGDLFLLDMGEPVRIKDLAEQMVRLSGLSVRSTDNPDGEIEIVCTGLRPGEKLYEELLINSKSESTAHPLIYRAIEPSIDFTELLSKLDLLQTHISELNKSASLELLSELVPEWTIKS